MEILIENLPQMVMSEIQLRYSQYDERAESLIDRIRDVLDGTRKKQVVDWWLGYIETQTDAFLQEKGYVKDALPYNYLDEVPDDMTVISRNLNLLKDLMSISAGSNGAEAGEGISLDDFLEKTTAEVYTVLDGLVSELEFITHLERTEDDLKYVGIVVTDHHLKSIQEDIEYLRTMRRMDDDIKEKRKRIQKSQQTSFNQESAEVKNFDRRDGEGAEGDQREREEEELGEGKLVMTHVVPVGGLIMARIHILECEHDSAVNRWRGRSFGWRKAGSKIAAPKVDMNVKQDVPKRSPDRPTVTKYSSFDVNPNLERDSNSSVTPEKEMDNEVPSAQSRDVVGNKANSFWKNTSHSKTDMRSIGTSQACVDFALNHSYRGTLTKIRVDKRVPNPIWTTFTDNKRSDEGFEEGERGEHM